jgi:threonine/homoserine/homoserine lactone efflux protein
MTRPFGMGGLPTTLTLAHRFRLRTQFNSLRDSRVPDCRDETLNGSIGNIVIGETVGMLTAFATFAGAAALVILIPGPDTLVVLRGIIRYGRRDAAATAAGVLTGLTMWVTAAAVGLTALLRASHDGYLALRLAGAGYLVFVGLQALRSRALGRPADVEVEYRSLVGRGFRAGLTTDLLNPKVGIFCITFLPAFIPHGAPVAPVTLGLGALFVAETAAYFAALLLVAARVTGWLRNDAVRRRLNRATGVVLIGFGIRLVAEG